MTGHELAAAVNLLTRDSMHRVLDGDGRSRFVKVEPLLVQLRVAIANSTASGSYGNGSGQPLPLAAAALDLEQQIAATVRDFWWQTHQQHHGHGRGKLALELRAWASVVQGDDAKVCLAYCTAWVNSIEGLLRPPRRWELRGACPECRATRYLVSEDDGKVWAPALSLAMRDDKSWAECLACGQTYEPQVLARRLASG